MQDTRQTILKTLALADAFNWALTGFEVWRYALDETGNGKDMPSLTACLRELQNFTQEGVLSENSGHYVFAGREELIVERIATTSLILKKRRRAKRWAKRMVHVPFVLGVFAYGSLASGHTRKESDLDVYVVMQNGRIFTGRVLVSLFLEIFGVRRTATKIQDQMCLNHFAIRDAISFQEQYRSPFSAWLWSRMFPLALKEDVIEAQFYDANQWVYGYFPNMRKEIGNSKLLVLSPSISLRINSAEGEIGSDNEFREQRERVSSFKFIGDAIERTLSRLQLKRILNHPLTKAGSGRIVANRREMIFHPSLPEEQVLARFHARLRRSASSIDASALH